MTPEQWRRVKSVLNACLEIPAERRTEWLDSECALEPEIRAEVESLMTSHEQAGGFLQGPVLEAADIVSAEMPPEKPEPGDHLGAYQIIEKIGEGGMGVVYRALRDDGQFRKLVAIKIVKRGMDTAYVLQRFQTERQILAHFDHPAIARLLDGGATDDGRPYVVVDFIDGQPLDEYCNSKGLSLTERLELFLKVCSAVEYAHRNLVVHRDLKPRNILVTPEGEPKLLDFGIAKVLTDDREFTLAGTHVMTPEYASPEQVRGEPITTASDVYSLGVVLYELLTGRRPYSVRGRPPDEVARIICQAEPARPSLSAPRLAGDLDNIVLMALRKEAGRRYASVEQFSGDIRRHLAGLPVEARKSTPAYRVSKFVVRHRAGVAAAGLVFLSLVAGIIVSVWQAHEANQQRRRAERRFQDVRKLANSMLFELHDALVPLAGSTKARELLVRKAQEYLDSLSAEALGDTTLERERALAYQRIGDVLGSSSQSNLGQTAAALQNYRKSQSIYQELLAADANNLDLKGELAGTYERICSLDESRGEFREALEVCHKALALREDVVRGRPDNRTARAELGYACQSLAGPYFLLGDWSRSEHYRVRALEIFEELHRAEPDNSVYHFQLAVAYLRLANLQETEKKYTEALKNARRSVALREEIAGLKPDDMRARVNITYALQRVGSVLSDLNDFPGALEAFRQALPIRERVVKLDPEDARSRLSLSRSYEAIGSVLLRMDRTTEAGENFGKQLALARQLVAKDPGRIEHQISLAAAYRNLGGVRQREAARAGEDSRRAQRWREARQHLEKALGIYADLRARGALSAEYAHIPPGIEQEIAVCNESLRKLGRATSD